MENHVFQKTPFPRLLIAALMGLGGALAALVLTGNLLAFIIVNLVGNDNYVAVNATISGFVGIFMLVTGPLGGVIADKTNVKFGRRRFWIIAGSIGGAISMLAIAYATAVPVIILGVCFANFFYGMVTTSCFAIVPEQIAPEKFGRVSGLFGAAGPIFAMTGMLIMGVFASVPTQQKFIAITIVQLICGIVAALLIKDNYFEGNEKSEKKSFIEGLKNFYPSPKKYPSFTWALLAKFFMYITNGAMGSVVMLYIIRFHLGETDIVKYMAYTAPAILLMAGAGIFGGFISDKFKKQKPFVMLAALITGVCTIVFAFSSNITMIMIGFFLFYFGFGMFGAVDNALVNRVLPSKEDAAKDISIMNTTTYLGGIVVSFASPMLISIGSKLMGDDGLTFFFLVLGCFAILSVLAIMKVPEVGKESEIDATLAVEEP